MLYCPPTHTPHTTHHTPHHPPTYTQASQDRAASAGLRRPYLRVVGIEVDSGGPGRAGGAPLTPVEEEELRQLAARPDIYDTIAKSIAPSIYGSLGEWISSLWGGGRNLKI